VHCVSVCTLMVTFGRAPGLPGEALRRAGVGGFVHDVANPLIPDPSLNKPGTQTDGEFLLVKRHSAKGRQILKCCSDVGEAPLDITLHHHERMDGKGYPEKLLAEKISKPARMVAFCRCLRCDHLGPAVSQRHRIHQGAAQNARMVQRPF